MRINRIRLGFGLGYGLVGGRCGALRLFQPAAGCVEIRISLSRTCSGPLQFSLVLIVERLNFLLGHVDVRANFLLNDLLGEDVVLQVLLELLEGDTLRLRRLLQIFHGLRVHLLAQFVEALDDVRVGADSKFLRFLRKQLGVNEIAQQVFLLGLVLRAEYWGPPCSARPPVALRCV